MTATKSKRGKRGKGFHVYGEGDFDDPGIERFASVGDFIEKFDEGGHQIRDNRSWTGETAGQVRDRLENGHTGAVNNAESILSDIDHGLNMNGLSPMWGRDVVGAFPDVPAYLAGNPESMIAMQSQRSRNTRTPLTIYYSPVTSAGISHEESFKRGCVVLAAVMALSRVRPVRCYYFTVLGRGDHVIPVKTDPLVLSEAAYILTSTAFYRSVSYEWATETAGWHGNWGKWSCMNGSPEYRWTKEQKIQHMRDVLGAEDDDIIIPSMHLREKDTMLSDPVAWINGLLDTYRQ